MYIIIDNIANKVKGLFTRKKKDKELRQPDLNEEMEKM